MAQSKPSDDQGFSASRSLFIGVFVLVLGIFVGSGLVQVLASLLLQDRSTYVMSGAGDFSEYEVWVYRVLVGLGNFFNWGLPGIVWILLAGQPTSRIGWQLPPKPFRILLVGLSMALALPLLQSIMLSPQAFAVGGWTGLSEWIEAQEGSRYESIRTLIGSPEVGTLLLNLLVLALIPAFSEELFFRAGLQRTLGRMMSPHFAVWLTAFLFSALHFQFLGFLPRLLLGAVLGYSYQRTGSLWVSVGGHFIYNGANLLISFLAMRGLLPIEIMEPSFEFAWWLVVPTTLASAVLLWVALRGRSQTSQ